MGKLEPAKTASVCFLQLLIDRALKKKSDWQGLLGAQPRRRKIIMPSSAQQLLFGLHRGEGSERLHVKHRCWGAMAKVSVAVVVVTGTEQCLCNNFGEVIIVIVIIAASPC